MHTMKRKHYKKKALAEQKAAFEKEYADRENKITEREAEFAELSKKVTTFPAELEKTIKQTEKTIGEQLNGKHNHEKELLAKEIEGERKLKDQTIATLQEKIKEQAALILQLTNKADNATQQVKEIAIKAVESSNNMRQSSYKEKDN
jgi:DNA mismatch repair protein MutH